MINEFGIDCKPWEGNSPPKRILAIRLQAMGDVVITLPYLLTLKRTLPEAQIDFLTRKEVASIPLSLDLFDKVFALGGGRNEKLILLHAFCIIPIMWWRRYDAVIDLQNNRVSGLVCWLLIAKSWSRFDRFSANSAGERSRRTIESIGLGENRPSFSYMFRVKSEVDIFSRFNLNQTPKLVVLNPAGAFETRNWPLNNYVGFARIWLDNYDPATKFIILGDDRIRDKAAIIEQSLEDKVINLVGKTTPFEAFAIIQRVYFVLSEDSGLMHMAWTSGVPTLAIFGSTRSDWSAPQGEHSMCLNSSDLACGNCMSAECRFGDVHCITRFTSELVFNKAIQLLNMVQGNE